MAGLEHRTDAHGKLAATVVTFPQTRSHTAFFVFHTLESVNPVGTTAFRTSRTIWPNNAFQLVKGRFLVMEAWFG